MDAVDIIALQRKLTTGGVIHSEGDNKIFQCATALIAEKNYKYIWKDAKLDLNCKSSGVIAILSGTEANKVVVCYDAGGNLVLEWKERGQKFTIRRSALGNWDQIKTSVVQFILGNVYGGLYAGRPLQGSAKEAIEWSKT